VGNGVALQRRAEDIELELATSETRLTDEIGRLRSLHEGRRTLAVEESPARAAYSAAQEVVDARRDEIAVLLAEREAVSKALAMPLPPDEVHAHLCHRALPDQDTERWTLRFWASISVSVLLLAVVALIVYGAALGISGVVGVLVIIAGIEALIRGRVLPFLASLAIILLIFTGIYLALTNIRAAIAGALVVAALALLVSNLSGFLRRR
jgi:hypothetical protein